ncbi:hypothetical protein [Microbacterium panaciterrae]
MTDPRIVSIDLTHLVHAALRREPGVELSQNDSCEANSASDRPN